MEMLKTPFAPRPKELDPVEGVGWGNQATLRLPTGPTYQNIELVTDITDPALISRVRLVLNGKEVISVTGQDLVNIQKHRKQYTEAGRYIIPLSDLSMRTKVGVRTGELVTLTGEIWMVYIQLADSIEAAPSIKARAQVTPAQATRVFLPRLYNLTWNAAASGRTPFDWSERSPLLSIKRMHFEDASVERVRVLRDNREEINVSKTDNAFDLKIADLEQNKDTFTLDFVRTGFGSEGRLSTAAVSQLQFELEKTAAGAVPVLIEAIERVGALEVA